jgi:hypothetical protein
LFPSSPARSRSSSAHAAQVRASSVQNSELLHFVFAQKLTIIIYSTSSTSSTSSASSASSAKCPPCSCSRVSSPHLLPPLPLQFISLLDRPCSHRRICCIISTRLPPCNCQWYVADGGGSSLSRP